MARIVVLDDEAPIRKVLTRWLRQAGHEPHDAATGVEALAAIDAGEIDLVITDINMPDMDGIEVLLYLRRNRPGLPVIVISGGGAVQKEELLHSASLLAATAALPKPIDFQALDATITRLLTPPPAGA